MAVLKYRIGGLLGGKQLILDDKFLQYKNLYGGNFKVPRTQIEAVVVGPDGMGTGLLKIVGKGTELATAKLPFPWAEKAQAWLLEQLES